MKNSVFAWTFVAFAAAAATMPSQVLAQDGAAGALFARLDADKSGDISLEEFVAAGNPRVAAADKDGDGKTTVEEMTAAFTGADAAERAVQLVNRFDTDKDGAASLAEVEARRKTNFARLDANSDGKLVKEEMLKAGQQ